MEYWEEKKARRGWEIRWPRLCLSFALNISLSFANGYLKSLSSPLPFPPLEVLRQEGPRCVLNPQLEW